MTEETGDLLVLDGETVGLIKEMVQITGWSPLKVVKLSLQTYVWMRRRAGKAMVLTSSEILNLVTGKDIEENYAGNDRCW